MRNVTTPAIAHATMDAMPYAKKPGGAETLVPDSAQGAMAVTRVDPNTSLHNPNHGTEQVWGLNTQGV